MTGSPRRPPQITDWHLAGEAGLYIRQSSAQQVRDHTGSAAFQESQERHLEALGYSKAQIRKFDEDQGRSGTSSEQRTDFQALMEEIKARRIRVVAMSEVSRLGRDEMELARFILLCELNNVVLLENGIVRDLREVGDWTLVKLQAVMAEGENRRKTQRCQAGRRAKAEKGIPVSRLPVGLERTPTGEAVKVEEGAVREILERLWREALEGRSLGEIGRRLRAEGHRLPATDHRGQFRWEEVTRARLHQILTNPLYAGQIALYRHRIERSPDGRKRIVRTKVDEQEWIPGKVEAYVSLEEFQRVQELLHSRTWAKRAPVGEGDALCPGLIHCGNCGSTLYVVYGPRGRDRSRRRGRHAYVCKGWRKHGNLGNPCMYLGGRMVDCTIEAIVLQALQPPSLASLRREILEENERRQSNSRLIAAEVREAQAKTAELRAYLEESRSRGTNPRVTQMYADELEVALGKQEEVERRAARTPPPVLLDTSQTFLEEVRAKFEQFPRLWQTGRLGPRERKAIVSEVVRRIDIPENGDTVQMRIALQSGATLSRTLFRPKARRGLLEALSAEGWDTEEIAAELRRRGILNAYGKPFTASAVQKLLGPRNRLEDPNLHAALTGLWSTGLSAAKIATQLNDRGFRNLHGKPWTEMTVKNLAKRLGLPVRWQPHRQAIQEAVRELCAQGLSDRESAEEVNRRGFRTYWGRPWTVAGIARVRRVLGIMRQSTPDGLLPGHPGPTQEAA